MAIQNLDPNLLEERLAGDYQVARKRVGDFSEAVGMTESRGSRAERRMAKGIRIKGKLYGQAELAEIDLNLQNLVEDLANQQEFTTLQDKSEYKLTQAKAFNQFREELMKKGMMIQEQMYAAKLDAATQVAMNKNIAQLAKGAGFAFAMKGMGGDPMEAMYQNATIPPASAGPMGGQGTFMAPQSQGVPTTQVYA